MSCVHPPWEGDHNSQPLDLLSNLRPLIGVRVYSMDYTINSVKFSKIV